MGKIVMGKKGLHLKETDVLIGVDLAKEGENSRSSVLLFREKTASKLLPCYQMSGKELNERLDYFFNKYINYGNKRNSIINSDVIGSKYTNASSGE